MFCFASLKAAKQNITNNLKENNKLIQAFKIKRFMEG